MTEKTQEPADPAKDRALAEVLRYFGDGALAVLDDYGVKPEDIKPADIAEVKRGNLDFFCSYRSPIDGVQHDGHTGPLMFLAIKETDSDEYSEKGYSGYVTVDALAPAGLVAFTASVPDSEDGSPLIRELYKMTRGNLFTIVRQKTRSGNRVFNVIPPVPPESGPAAA